ncbi:CopL family metal-binding regulatory protein [Pseudoxanthomonas mexicana]|uniref:CopL family metal-binding regulatory protein n=1 Tax=Pseudoxanthomonas mexicana TaxID=128785 RepID=UPI0036082B2C
MLLSVALILNGATTAMASVHMAHGAASSVAAPAQKTIASAPCHERHAASVKSDGMAAPADSAAPDCCGSDSSACRSVCMHSSPVAVSMTTFAPVQIEHPRSLRPLSLGHATPALPHLIRPPIG